MTQTTQNEGGNAPALIAYHVPNRRNAPWIRIGAAWSHKKGVGYSLKIEMLPLEILTAGELNIQLRQPDPKDDAGQSDQDGGNE